MTGFDFNYSGADRSLSLHSWALSPSQNCRFFSSSLNIPKVLYQKIAFCKPCQVSNMSMNNEQKPLSHKGGKVTEYISFSGLRLMFFLDHDYPACDHRTLPEFLRQTTRV